MRLPSKRLAPPTKPTFWWARRLPETVRRFRYSFQRLVIERMERTGMYAATNIGLRLSILPTKSC